MQRLSRDGAAFEFEWGTLFYVRKLLVLWAKCLWFLSMITILFFKKRLFLKIRGFPTSE